MINEWTEGDFKYYGHRIDYLRDQFNQTHNKEAKRELVLKMIPLLESMIELGLDEIDDLSKGRYVATFEAKEGEPFTDMKGKPSSSINVGIQADSSPDAQTRALKIFKNHLLELDEPFDISNFSMHISFMPDSYVMEKIARIMGEYPTKTPTRSAESAANTMRKEIINKYEYNISVLRKMIEAIQNDDMDAMRDMAGGIKSQAFPTELVGSRKATEKERESSYKKAEQLRLLGSEMRAWTNNAEEFIEMLESGSLKTKYSEAQRDYMIGLINKYGIETAKDCFDLAKEEQERVPDVKFIRQPGEKIKLPSGGPLVALPPTYITAKPASDAFFQVPLSFIDNMMLVGNRLGATLKGGKKGAERQSKGRYVGKRPYHLESKEKEICPICEQDFCRCCPVCKSPTCVCEEIENDRVKMISEFVPEDLIQ